MSLVYNPSYCENCKQKQCGAASLGQHILYIFLLCLGIIPGVIYYYRASPSVCYICGLNRKHKSHVTCLLYKPTYCENCKRNQPGEPSVLQCWLYRFLLCLGIVPGIIYYYRATPKMCHICGLVEKDRLNQNGQSSQINGENDQSTRDYIGEYLKQNKLKHELKKSKREELKAEYIELKNKYKGFYKFPLFKINTKIVIGETINRITKQPFTKTEFNKIRNFKIWSWIGITLFFCFCTITPPLTCYIYFGNIFGFGNDGGTVLSSLLTSLFFAIIFTILIFVICNKVLRKKILMNVEISKK